LISPGWPRHPSSASTRSPGTRKFLKTLLKKSMSILTGRVGTLYPHQCWVWLTYSAMYSRIQPFLYPAISQSCDPKLLPFTNLPSKLIVTALFGRFKKVSPRYRTEGVSIQSHLQLNVPRPHMVLQQLLFQLNWERRIKIWCQYISTGIEYLKSIQPTASSWRQISKSSWQYIYISIRIFQLLWNICDCFFHRAAWVIISSSACREGLQSRVWAIPSSFYFGPKSFKASVQPKSFNCINSYPTMNPTHPPWLITKPSWFIRSTSCGYELKKTLTSSSKQS
jgi:hypothetical protein